MSRPLLKLQVAVLGLGTLFSWFTLFIDERRSRVRGLGLRHREPLW